MQEKTIKYFKKFLTNRGANVIFASLYKDYKFNSNPTLLEAYLTEVKPPFAITMAFDFNRLSANSAFDPAYWNRLHIEWNTMLLQWKNGEMKSAEEIIENRLEILDKKLKEKAKNQQVDKDEEIPWFGEFLSPLNTAPKTSSPSIADDEIRFTIKNGRIVFSSKISAEIMKIENPKMSMFVHEESETLYLRFSTEGSHDLQLTYSKFLVAAQSKSFVNIIRKYTNTLDDTNPELYIKTNNVMWHPNKSIFVLPIKREWSVR